VSSDNARFIGKLFGARDAAGHEAKARRLDAKAASTRDTADAKAHAKAGRRPAGAGPQAAGRAVSRQHEHRMSRDGKVQVVRGKTVPRPLRGADPWTEATVRVGPLARIAAAVADRIGR